MHLVFIIIGTPPGFLYTCFSFSSSSYLSKGQYFSKWSIFSLVMFLIGCMPLDGFIGLVLSLSSYSIFFSLCPQDNDRGKQHFLPCVRNQVDVFFY